MAKGIYKRGNIFWIRYAGLNGKTLYESSASSKFRDAETLLIKRKQTIKEGKQPEVKKRIPNVTFKELAKAYLDWAKRQRGFRSKKGFVLQFVDIYGSIPLRYFNGMVIEKFQSDRIGKGNKPATVNRLVATIKHMFSKAVEWEMVEEEIQKKIRRVKLLEANNRRLRYLSKEECQNLIKVCESYLRPIIIFALNSGCRKNEILSLKWENVDLQHGFILLDQTKNGERRELPINETLRVTLESLPRRLDGGYVFYDPKTDERYKDVKRSFATALRKAGIKDFHFHDLRHTFASHLVMAGVDIMTVKELLGHKTLAMTLRYSHLSPKHLVKALSILDDALNDNINYTKTIQFGRGTP